MRKGAIDLTEAKYREVIRRKTAVLFEGTCRASAILADVSQQKEAALGAYGLNLGLAFQMADDLLDYTQDISSLGKHAGADLREGKMTLPLIHALSRAPETDRQRMVAILENPNFTGTDFVALVEMLKCHGGIAYTEEKAAVHIQTAKTALQPFGDSPMREILMDIADYALVRKA